MEIGFLTAGKIHRRLTCKRIQNYADLSPRRMNAPTQSQLYVFFIRTKLFGYCCLYDNLLFFVKELTM